MRAPSSPIRAGLQRRSTRDATPLPGAALLYELNTSLGTAPESFRALPRPDSDGFVIK